jgi:hypothetical protein
LRCIRLPAGAISSATDATDDDTWKRFHFPERRVMIPDLIIALAFLVMIIVPAIVSIPDRDERDSL